MVGDMEVSIVAVHSWIVDCSHIYHAISELFWCFVLFCEKFFAVEENLEGVPFVYFPLSELYVVPTILFDLDFLTETDDLMPQTGQTNMEGIHVQSPG
jgi:hypothetical protein